MPLMLNPPRPLLHICINARYITVATWYLAARLFTKLRVALNTASEENVHLDCASN